MLRQNWVAQIQLVVQPALLVEAVEVAGLLGWVDFDVGGDGFGYGG